MATCDLNSDIASDNLSDLSDYEEEFGLERDDESDVSVSSSETSDSSDYIDRDKTEEEFGLGDDDQSDVSVSSPETSDSSDLSDQENDDNVSEDEKWHSDVQELPQYQFNQPIGPKKQLGLDAKPIDYFYQLMPTEVFENMVVQTNFYAEQKKAANFVPVTIDEIKAYLGILLFMGVNQFPDYSHYWDKRFFFKSGFVAKVMTVKRYEQITKYFHLNDSSKNPPNTDPKHDKLHKIRPIINNAKDKFPSHYNPPKNMVLDETMMKFRASNSYPWYKPPQSSRSFLPESSKSGIRTWVLVDLRSYYVVDFDIHAEKEYAATNNSSFGVKLVTDLLGPYFNKGHHIYFEKFSTSVELMETLQEKNTYACGRVKYNRQGLPSCIKNVKLKASGKTVIMQKGSLLAINWCDEERRGTLLSTINDVGDTQITKKARHRDLDSTFPMPVILQKYSRNSYFLHKHAEQYAHMGIAVKAKKWWKYVFCFFCDVTMINAFILYRKAPGGPRSKPLSQPDFHLDVVKSLVNGFSSRKRLAQVNGHQPVIKKPTGLKS